LRQKCSGFDLVYSYPPILLHAESKIGFARSFFTPSTPNYGIIMSFTQPDPAANQATQGSYTIDMTHGTERQFHIACQFPDRSDRETIVQMPVWSPGSYLIREYSKNLTDFVATNAAGDPLQVEQIAKDRWLIHHAQNATLNISYRIYGGELTVRTPYLTSLRAMWQTTSLFVIPLDEELSAWTIRTIVPEDWQSDVIATPVADKADTWSGTGKDRFFDTVGMAGPLTTWNFEIGGVPHRMVFDGEGNFKQEDILPLVEPGMKQAEMIFRGDMDLVDGRTPALPVDDFAILTALANEGGGGLEHVRGTLLLWQRFSLRSKWDRLRFTSLCVHEYFHFWNVKHIRPNAFYDFNYDRENYTTNLYEIEGITSYYEVMLTGRGLSTLDDASEWIKDWLKLWDRKIQTHESYPGKTTKNLRDASFEAWTKFYRQDENFSNENLHYYLKGAIVTAMLDSAIREFSNDEKSFDDVMHQLWRHHLETGRGYDPDELREIVQQATGFDPTEIFEAYVDGVDPLPYADLWLDRVGLKFSDPDDDVWLGITFKQQRGQVLCSTVVKDGPAHSAGISNGDELIAIDGWRVLADPTTADWHYKQRIKALNPGDQVSLTLSREGRLLEVALTAGVNPAMMKLKPIDDPSESQCLAFTNWCGFQHPNKKSDS
jgi:predicted metalloprotease with PDZ domain